MTGSRTSCATTSPRRKAPLRIKTRGAQYELNVPVSRSPGKPHAPGRAR